MKLNLVYIIFFTFILLASRSITSIGAYYDELLHAVSTQKMMYGSEYRSEISQIAQFELFGHTIPIMTLYYVGPLKAFALLPFFLVFGSDLIILRSVTILFATVSLFLTYLLTKQTFSKSAALITSFLLAFDTSFIYSARFDWGPVSIQMILKLIILIVFFKIIKTQNYFKKDLIALGFFSGLMLWDKLNAIWLLVPLYGLLLFFMFKHRADTIQVTRLLCLILISAIIGALPLIVFVIKKPYFYTVSTNSFQKFEQYWQATNQTSNLNLLLKNYSSNASQKYSTLLKTFNGTAIPEHILTKILPPTVLTLLFIFSILIICYLSISLKHSFKFNLYLYLILFFSILSFFLVTPNANGPHHVLMLWPLPHIICGYIFSALFTIKPKAVLFLLLLVSSFSLIQLQWFDSLAKQNDVLFYWQKNRDTQLIRNLNNQVVYSLDWGITLPLAFETKGRINIADLQPFYDHQCDKIKSTSKYRTTFVTYVTPNQVFPTYYNNCKQQLKQLNIVQINGYIIYSSTR